MKKYLHVTFFYFLVSYSTDSNPEYSEMQSNSETLKTQSVPKHQRLNSFDSNGQRYYDLLELHLVSTNPFSHVRGRKDRDWEKL